MSHGPSVGELLRTWQADPGVVALLVASAAAYLVGAHRARHWPALRSAAFLAGLAAIALALLSGIDAYADRLLSVHMAEHMLLTVVAAPLVLAGAPLTLALRTTRGSARAALVRLLHGRAARSLSIPAVAFAPFPLALLATHLSPFYDYTLHHGWAHALEHAVYFWSALLFFLPVVGSEPLPHTLGGLGKSLYMVAGMVPMTAIAAVLMAAEHPLYPTYARTLANPVADQRLAAAIMWVFGGMLMAAVAVVSAWRAWETEERRTRAREAYGGAP